MDTYSSGTLYITPMPWAFKHIPVGGPATYSMSITRASSGFTEIISFQGSSMMFDGQGSDVWSVIDPPRKEPCSKVVVDISSGQIPVSTI